LLVVRQDLLDSLLVPAWRKPIRTHFDFL
jgi:hypothetical protein